jgi:hypothetical protein
MSLGWKIDDPARTANKSAEVEDLHATQLHVSILACFLISAVHLRESLSKLQGDSLAHHAHRVHGIHQSFGWRFDQIASGCFDHRFNNTN